MSITKLKGFHIPLQLIKFIEKFSKEIRLPESRIVEALIDYLEGLPDQEKKRLIADYISRSI